MSITTPILPVSFTLPSSMELLDTYRLHIKPRDLAGNKVTAYLPLDEVSPYPNKSQGWFKEVISNTYCPARGTKTYTPSIKFGTDCSWTYSSGFIKLPADNPFQDATKFTIDIIVKFISVAAGADYIIGGGTLSTTIGTFAFMRNATTLQFAIWDSSGLTSLATTTGLTLNTTDVWRLRVSYDGSFANGSCLASVSAAVDGNDLVPYITATNCKKINSYSPLLSQGIYLGGHWADHATYGYYGPTASTNAYRNECIFYKDLILSPTGTPPTTALRPFATTTDEATVILDSGESGGIWDFSTFSFPTEDYAFTFRVKSGESNPPTLEGAPLTYSQVRSLTDTTGRYLKIGVTCTDAGGLTDHILMPGVINYIPAEIVIPSTPEVTEVTRVGDIVTVTVSGVDPGVTCNIYGFAAIGTGDCLKITFLGSRVGNGDITFDASSFYMDFWGYHMKLPVQVMALAEIAGISSPLPQDVLPKILDFFDIDNYINSIARSETGESITINFKNLNPDVVSIFWSDSSGKVSSTEATENGDKVISGLVPTDAVGMVGMSINSLKAITGFGNATFSGVSPKTASIIPRTKPEVVNR